MRWKDRFIIILIGLIMLIPMISAGIIAYILLSDREEEYQLPGNFKGNITVDNMAGLNESVLQNLSMPRLALESTDGSELFYPVSPVRDDGNYTFSIKGIRPGQYRMRGANETIPQDQVTIKYIDLPQTITIEPGMTTTVSWQVVIEGSRRT